MSDERVKLESESTEAFVERRRFEDIFEARKHVKERLRKRPKAENQGAESPVLDADLNAAVRALVMETMWLYESSELGQGLWENRVFGPVHVSEVLPPPPEDESLTGVDGGRLPDSVAISDGALVMQGVKGYIGVESSKVTVTAQKELKRRGDATEDVEHRVEIIPPKRIAEAVFSTTDELLAELGVLGELGGEDYRADEPGA